MFTINSDFFFAYCRIIADHRHQQQKENCRNEQVHPYRVQVAGAAALYILICQETRPQQQWLHSAEELTVKMRHIVKEVNEQVPYRFFRLYILLAAVGTVAARKLGATVQAYLFFTFVQVRHRILVSFNKNS